MPPPDAAAASMARLIAGVSMVWPSPVAPKDFTLRMPTLARTSAKGEGSAAMSLLNDGAAARTAPRPAIENKCLRSNRDSSGRDKNAANAVLYMALPPGLSIVGTWGGVVVGGSAGCDTQATGVRYVQIMFARALSRYAHLS